MDQRLVAPNLGGGIFSRVIIHRRNIYHRSREWLMDQGSVAFVLGGGKFPRVIIHRCQINYRSRSG
jgi:hypothetical protein